MRNFYSNAYCGFLLLGLMAASCASYRQNIMFTVPEDYPVQKEIQTAEKNYTIQKNDNLSLDVYTNEGERIIDPDLKLQEGSAQNAIERPAINYQVDINGIVRFPMIGELKVEGLTIRQAEEILQKEFAKFYREPYVMLRYTNKRVFVLGAPGGKVIPLTHENMTLIEILALAEGVSTEAKANNIRILRGEQVFVADLSTVQGYKAAAMVMEPADIIYIEPIRRPLSEGLRDYGPIVSIISSLTTLIVVFWGIN